MRPKNWIALGMLIVLLIPTVPGAFSANMGGPGRAAGTQNEPWWFPGWQCRAPIAVVNPNSMNLTNFSMPILIPYDSDMNANFSDLRFTQHVGSDIFEIPYWLETVSPSTQAKAWLKAPYLTSAGDSTIYMYYSNPTSDPVSDPNTALAFYDDFEGTTLNTTRWIDPHIVDTASSVSLNGGMLDFTVNSGSAATGGCVISNVTLEPGNYVAETKVKFTAFYRSAFGAYAGFTDNVLYDDANYGNPAKLVSARLYDYTGTTPTPYLALRVNDFTPVDVTGTTAITVRNIWFKMRTIYTPPTYAKGIFTQLENPYQELSLEASGSSGIIPKYVVVGIGDRETAEHTYFDYILVRKYAPQEPAGLIGKEERTFTLKSLDLSPAQPMEGEMVTITAVFTNPTSEVILVPVSLRIGVNFSDARTIFDEDITLVLRDDTTVITEWKAVPGTLRMWLGTYGRPLTFVDIMMEPDTVPPITTVLPLPKYVNSTDFTVSWTSPEEDTSNVYFSVYVSEDNGATFTLWLNWTPELSGIFPGVDGRKYQFFSLGRDLSGNLEGLKTLPEASTTVDSIQPRSTLLLAPYQKTASFYVNWTSNDTGSGITGYSVFVSDNGAPFKTWLANVTKRSDRYSGVEKHEYKFYVMARDAAGNLEASNSNNTKTTKVDPLAPSTTLVLAGSTYGSDPVYLTPATTMTMEVKDDNANVATFYQLEGGPVLNYSSPLKGFETGSHNMTYWSVDGAGNEEKRQSLWFSIDGNAPVTSIVFDGSSFTGEAITFLAAGTRIILDPQDEGSGLTATTYRIDNMDPVAYASPFTLDKPGVHTLIFNSVDNLGNVERIQTFKLQSDSYVPTTIAVVPSVPQRYDYTVKLKTSDTESGVSATFYRIAVPEGGFSDWEVGTEILMEARPDHSADGTYTIEYYSIDNVGHVEQVKSVKVGVDTISTLSLNIKGTTSSDKSVFTIIGQAEPGSRVLVNGLLAQVDADGYFTFDIDLKEGSNKVQVVAIDPAGNIEQLTRSVSYSPIAQFPEWMVWTVAILVVAAAACVITVLLARGGRRPALR
jgi:hypothetical protein